MVPLLADDANFGDAFRQRPAQLDLAMAKFDPDVLDVRQEHKRAERDRADRFGRAAFAQNSVRDRVARHHVHVVKLTGADLGNPGTIARMFRALPRLRTMMKVSEPSPSSGGGVQESRIRSPSTCIERRRGIGRSPFQSGQGFGKIDGDGQALAIEVRAAQDRDRSRFRARAAKDSARRSCWARLVQAS